MDLRKLKTLIELVESSGIAELEISEGEERVRITRSMPPAQRGTVGAARSTPSVVLTIGDLDAPAPGAIAPSPSRKDTPSNRRWSAPSIGPPRRARSRSSRSATTVQVGRPALHHRSDEADERNRSRSGRRGQSDPCRERPARRVRPTAGRDRLMPEHQRVRRSRRRASERWSPAIDRGHADSPDQLVRQGPDRQPRRDRAAHPARLPRARHQDRRRPLGGRRRRQVRAARRRIGVHRPGAVRAQLSEHPGDHQRGRSDRRRRRSIPATGSSPKTPTSPKKSRRAASYSSARARKRSGSWATR